jgi:RHS repeat-associated protein
LGKQVFELSNHLGNQHVPTQSGVLATITDKKLQVSLNTTSTAYFEADVQTVQDYYAFGMQMPGRKLSGGYRYGFNGKENDNEVKGEGNSIDYGFRSYDPRLNRFLSVDPLTRKYPELTPYQFASNTPIQAIDLDGLEKLIYVYNFTADKITKTKIELLKAGPLGNGVLVKSDYNGMNHYYYGGEIPEGNITSFKKAYEGVKLNKKGEHVGYFDSNDFPTIGYGHLIVKGESYKVGSTITDKEAVKLFDDESTKIKGQVDKKIANYTLDANQKNALYDASFNMGPGKLSQYSEDDSKFSGENFFLKFMAGGEGIMKRRFAENLLYSEGKYYNFDVLKVKKLQLKAEKIITDNTPKQDASKANDTDKATSDLKKPEKTNSN